MDESDLERVLRDAQDKIGQLETEQSDIDAYLKSYLDLKDQVVSLQKQSADEDLNTLVDLGSGMRVRAKIDDPKRIIVHIGLGIYLDVTLEEANVVADKWIKHLNEQAEKVITKMSEAKAQTGILSQTLDVLNVVNR